MAEMDDSIIDDVSEVDIRAGLDEVLATLQPFLLDQSLETELKEKLIVLGVESISDIKMLQESDFTNLISVIRFRSMLQQFQTNTSTSGDNSTAVQCRNYSVNLRAILSKTFLKTLDEDKEILSQQDRRKLILLVADDIRENVKQVTKKLVQREAMKLVRAHPTSLGCLMKDETDILEASFSLSSSILGHIYYITSQLKSKRSSGNSSGMPAKSPRFSKAQCCGLDPQLDLPNDLPSGETPETQELKRLLMVNLGTSGEPINWNAVKKMMSETYHSQREDINNQLSMDELLLRWPFIGKHSVLQAHFERLKGIRVAEAVTEASTLFPKLTDFFGMEANKKRKGKSATIPRQLKEILKAYSREQEENPSKHFLLIVLCAMVFMEVPLEQVFVCFEETTSFDQIQASEKIPKHPVIAVLGDDIQDNPQAFVLVDKCIISEDTVTVAKAVNMLLMSYYVFKIEYNTKGAPILHFIQRKFFRIEDEGTRTERRKTSKGFVGAPPTIPNQLLRLMKDFKQYCSEWNLSY